MKVNVTTWTTKDLVKEKSKINEQPKYQRGEVWNDGKKSLLIDSMLRGIDIPKVYLRKLSNDAYDYEVADGQQRITAIIKFRNNRLQLPSHEDKGLNLSEINGEKVGGKTYGELSKNLQEIFDNYTITIAILSSATNDEIRTLFGRLQEGSSLNPAEKRNAIISSIGDHIDNFALNHTFFSNSKIPESRFKRQDYVAHILTLVAYGNSRDLKAKALLELYLDKKIRIQQNELTKIDLIFDIMREIDEKSITRITRKFHFIDLFYFLYNNVSRLESIKSRELAEKFDDFEKLRKKHHSDPKKLLEKKPISKSDEILYDYVTAFKADGSSISSINKRLNVFNKLFVQYLN